MESSEKITYKQKYQKILPILLFLPLIILVQSDASLVLVNQVLIIAEFELEENFAVVGGVVAVSQITLAISTIISGWLADKYSRKRLLILYGLTWSLGEFLVYIAPNIYFLYLFRIIGSFGAGGCTPVTMSLLSDIFSSEKRGNSFAWWGLATTLGGLGGGSIAFAYNQIDYDFADDTISLIQRIQYIQQNYSLEVISKWRIPFLLMSILGVSFCILVLFVKEPKRGSSESALKDVLVKEEVEYSMAYKIKKEDLKYIYKRKSNFWLIVNFIDTIFSGLILGFLVTWLTVEVGMSLDWDGISSALPFFILLIVFLLWGQFWFAKLGDKKVELGDYSGRVKVAILCGVVHIPLMIMGFLFYPNIGNKSFFKGDLNFAGNNTGFILFFCLMGLILGVGMGFQFGIAPNWYSSMMDVNLPEHRGTMIAAASFMDAIGRALGAWLGGVIIDWYSASGSNMPISDTIIFCTLTFGVLSSLLWLPILKYCENDFSEIAETLEKRAKELEQLAEEKERELENGKSGVKGDEEGQEMVAGSDS